MQAATTEGLAGLKAQVEGINAKEESAAQANIDRIKKSQEEAGLYGIEQEKRLKEQEEGVGKAERVNLGLAAFNAGLAIMAGTSANPFENIGKGAMVGAEAYTKGLARIDDKRDKLFETRDRLDAIRRGEMQANRKEENAAQAAYDRAKVESEKALYAFGSKAFDMSRQDARDAVEFSLRREQIAASNRPSSEMQMIDRLMKEEKLTYAQALKRASELSAKPAAPFNFKEAYADYLTKTIGPAMTYEQYVRQFALTNTPPQGAAVLPR
jgi:hypothetical protein